MALRVAQRVAWPLPRRRLGLAPCLPLRASTMSSSLFHVLDAELRIPTWQYRPPPSPFAAAAGSDADSWTQEGETDEWYRFLAPVGSTGLGAAMLPHFMRKQEPSPAALDLISGAGAARLPFEHAAAWRLLAEERPDTFAAHLPRHLGYSIRKLAAFVGASATDLQLLNHGCASDGLRLALGRLGLHRGQSVLVVEGSAPALLSVILGEGASLVIAKLPPWSVLVGDDNGEAATAAVVAAITPHLPHCQIAVLEQVSALSGIEVPVAPVLALCRKHGVRTVLDRSQGLGMDAGDLPASASAAATAGADLCIAQLHCWFSLPKAVALLWQPHHNDTTAVNESAADARPGSSDGAADLTNSKALVLRGSSAHTEDFSAALSIPIALDVWRTVGFERARRHCTSLLDDAVAHCQAGWGSGDDGWQDRGLPPPGSALPSRQSSLAGATATLVALPTVLQPSLPPLQQAAAGAAAGDSSSLSCAEAAAAESAASSHLQQRLMDGHGISCEIVALHDVLWARLPAHIYRSVHELGALIDAVASIAQAERERRRLGPAVASESAGAGPPSCVVYKTESTAAKRSSIYLYVADDAAVDSLPPQLSAVLGALVPCDVTIDLLRGGSLAGGSTTRAEVRKRLLKSGYFMSRAAKIY